MISIHKSALAGALAIASLAVFAMPARSLRASIEDEQKLEQYLARLGLIDLQILQLEKLLAATPAGPKQIETAKQLADLYAARLMQASDDQARYDEVLASIGDLTSRIPQAKTTALEVMLLQADYTRGEAQLTKWLEDRGQTEARDDAKQTLTRIAPLLQSHQEELNEQLRKLQIDVERETDDAKLAKLDQELKRFAPVVYRATFFAGWANYFCGVAQFGEPEAAERFAAAKSAFRQFLTLNPDEKYEEIEVGWLGLESSYRARALVGLAQAEVATGDIEAARTLFKFLDDASAPPALRDQAPMFFVQALLNAGKYAEAAKYATEQIATYQGRATQGKVSLCIALIRTGFTSADDELRSMGDLGVRGLAKLGEIGLAHQVLAKHGVDFEAADDFYLQWLKGHAQFADAEKTKNPADYKTAAETLKEALAHEDALRDVVSAGQCRYTLGWSLYKQEQYEEAAEQFQQAATALKSAASGDAALQAAWMGFASYYALVGKGERRFVSPATEALVGVKRDFPASDQAKKADFLITQLRKSAMSPEETIEALSAIGPGEPNYLSARHDLCRVLHEQWQGARGTAEEANWAGQLERAADTYQRAARSDGNIERKLKVQLWVADIPLNGSMPDLHKAEELLDRAAPLIDALPATSSAVADYHYKRLQWARGIGDDSRKREEAEWLATNAAGSVYELSAVIVLAQDANQAIDGASAENRQAALETAAEVYRRLCRIVGETPKILAEVKNARVANAQLTQYDYELRNYQQAAERAERLLAAYPDDRDYLRLAGLSRYFAGDYQAAVDHLRPLVTGLPKNSQQWHEAKYYQLAALAHVDKSDAVEVYQQFQLLYPDADVEPWQTDREGLRRSLSN